MVITSFKVLMFPWLAYGHISPNLELAKKLTDRGFSVYLCSTPVNLGFIKNKITAKHADSIHLVELHLPENPELPPRYHTTNGLPPHLMSTLKNALYKAKPNLSKIMEDLNPDLVIYDVVQTWTGKLTSDLNIPAVKFSTSSAAMMAYFCHMLMKRDEKFPYPAIYLSEIDYARARTVGESAKADAEELDPAEERPNRFCDKIVLVKSSKEIEEKYMDYLSEVANWKTMGVGTLFQSPVFGDEDENNELIQWLGTKNECSSVFVSFGSEYFLTKEEMEEVAFGLELSNVNFIWVVRFPAGEKIRPEDALPEGFLERVKGRGKIVEGWAAQAKILAHPSIGGFVCHCGWNSVVESVEFGVPIIAMPMHLDQPLNARLMVELGLAVEVMRNGEGKLEREVIAEVVKDVVVEKFGENARKNMVDVRQRIKQREDEELDEVVQLLNRLCEEKRQNEKSSS
ncbi:OLC1v1026275C1 [Oldenlandia corymbosa var. corymbosa]|uniref:Glycosyltransferase n=1 Tax=Oldenlandia corymbosa var. corymbosa TaxID=529605 RepID=A0AAV1C7H8_OLDCO|nr:OLC1v1026275C1 [Oldenlandia corymbosa var. corymbosa]